MLTLTVNPKNDKPAKLRAPAKEVVAKWADLTRMDEIDVLDLLIGWFNSQPEEVGRAILGLYGPRTPDVARLILEEMAGSGGDSPGAKATTPPQTGGGGFQRGATGANGDSSSKKPRRATG